MFSLLRVISGSNTTFCRLRASEEILELLSIFREASINLSQYMYLRVTTVEDITFKNKGAVYCIIVLNLQVIPTFVPFRPILLG
jgi:hypothetical protein